MAKVLAAALSVGALAVAAIVVLGSDGEGGSSPPKIPAEAQDAYFVGSGIEDLRLTEVLVPPHGAGDSTSFIYGTCHPAGDAGCAPPLEIQTWDLCDRPPDDAPGQGELVDVRGAKASFAPAEELVEVYTGSKTAVIFAESGVAEQVLDELRQVAGPQPPSELAPPSLRDCGDA